MKLRLTASSISSIAISSTIRLRRLRKMPTTLIANRIAPSTRKWLSDRLMPRSFLLRRHGDEAHALLAARPDLLGGRLVARVLAPAQGERDGGDDRHQQDHRGDLERVAVVGVEHPAELARVAVVRRQLARRAAVVARSEEH